MLLLLYQNWQLFLFLLSQSLTPKFWWNFSALHISSFPKQVISNSLFKPVFSPHSSSVYLFLSVIVLTSVLCLLHLLYLVSGTHVPAMFPVCSLWLMINVYIFVIFIIIFVLCLACLLVRYIWDFWILEWVTVIIKCDYIWVLTFVCQMNHSSLQNESLVLV